MTIPAINFLSEMRGTKGYAIIVWSGVIIAGYIFYRYKIKKIISIIFILIFVLRDKKRKFESWLILAVAASVLLGLFTSPGILAAILLLIIGYEKQDNFLLILSNVFLIGFVYLFYYNLNINLAYKSWILAGSGLLLLGVRQIAKQFKPKEAKS